MSLIDEHIVLGINSASSATSSSSLSKNGQLSFSDPLLLQKVVDAANSQSLISQLDLANDTTKRTLIIQNYLSTQKILLEYLQKFSQAEDLDIKSYTAKIQTCNLPIEEKNKSYQNAVLSYQYQQANNLSQEIAQLRACVAENTVYYKQHLLYKDMMDNSFNALQKKIVYLDQQKDTIAKHYEILKPQLLKQLYDVSQTLQANF